VFESSGRARLLGASPPDGKKDWHFSFGENLGFQLFVDAELPMEDVEIGVGLFSVRGFEVASWNNKCSNTRLSLQPGKNHFSLRFDDLRLLPGQYYYGIGIRSGRGFEDYIPKALTISVISNETSAQINAHTFKGVLVPNAGIVTIDC
jgi:hypothetical protein